MATAVRPIGIDAASMRVKISPQAVVQRVNRIEIPLGRRVRLANRWHNRSRGLPLGRCFVTDMTTDEVVAADVDLEQLARQLRCLRPYEAMAPDLYARIPSGREPLGTL